MSFRCGQFVIQVARSFPSPHGRGEVLSRNLTGNFKCDLTCGHLNIKSSFQVGLLWKDNGKDRSIDFLQAIQSVLQSDSSFDTLHVVYQYIAEVVNFKSEMFPWVGPFMGRSIWLTGKTEYVYGWGVCMKGGGIICAFVYRPKYCLNSTTVIFTPKISG